MPQRSAIDELRQFRADVAALGGPEDAIGVDIGITANGKSPWAEPVDAPQTAVDASAPADDLAIGVWPEIRKSLPGWLVSGATHAVLLLVLGFTVLSSNQAAQWLGLEMTSVEPADPTGDALDSGGNFEGTDAEIQAGGGGGTITGEVASLEPITTVPVNVDISGLAVAGPSIGAEINAMVGDGRELALGTGSGAGGGNGAGEGVGVGEGKGPGTGGKGGKGGNGYAMFYGTEARGQRFVYVVDSSESMTGLRFERACAELMTSIVGLDSRQSFYVIFFNTTEFPQYYPLIDNFLSTANGQGVDKLGAWMRNVRPMGGTNPAPALKRALELEPDAVFLLSDGEFDLRPTMFVLENYNKGRAVVHTIAFGSPVGEPMLERIANVSGGNYRFVPLNP